MSIPAWAGALMVAALMRGPVGSGVSDSPEPPASAAFSQERAALASVAARSGRLIELAELAFARSPSTEVRDHALRVTEDARAMAETLEEHARRRGMGDVTPSTAGGARLPPAVVKTLEVARPAAFNVLFLARVEDELDATLAVVQSARGRVSDIHLQAALADITRQLTIDREMTAELRVLYQPPDAAAGP